ncbi:MAG TPA: hypothetical protein VNO86_09140 [Candidatus Binatia bacterium]|nr:hypothetical protein [Candidatus Binatia bacterium]
MSRPTGVTILAILAAIGGVLGLLGGLAIIGVGGIAGGVVGGAAGAAIGGLAVIGGLIVLVLAVLELALAYGFWNLRPWAWQLGVILAAVQIVIAILGVLRIVFYQDLSGAIISIAISGVILYYLNQVEIRRAFNAPEKGFPGFPDGLPGLK